MAAADPRTDPDMANVFKMMIIQAAIGLFGGFIRAINKDNFTKKQVFIAAISGAGCAGFLTPLLFLFMHFDFEAMTYWSIAAMCALAFLIGISGELSVKLIMRFVNKRLNNKSLEQ